MPLSEEELRLLEQMERALVEEDPKLASTLRGTTVRRTSRRRAILAGLAFVVGVVVMMSGAVAQLPVVGVVGFGIMLISATVALTALRAQNAAPAGPRPSGHEGFGVVDGGRRHRPRRNAQRAQRTHGTFMERLEERWRHRRESGDF